MGFRDVRKKRGLTQTQVAEQMGVSKAAVCLWESGETFPHMRHLVALSELYQAPIEELLRKEE